MGRQSSEAKAAALWRVGAKPPAPPKGLPAEATALWRKIVESKPADWFDPGSLVLLEQLCRLAISCRQAIEVLEELEPADEGYAYTVDKTVKLSAQCATLATKLRLTVQANIARQDRRTAEREPEVDDLIGGSAWGDRASVNLG